MSAFPEMKADAYDELMAVTLKHAENPSDGIVLACHLSRLAVAMARTVFLDNPELARDYLVACINQHLKDVDGVIKEKGL